MVSSQIGYRIVSTVTRVPRVMVQLHAGSPCVSAAMRQGILSPWKQTARINIHQKCFACIKYVIRKICEDLVRQGICQRNMPGQRVLIALLLG